MAEGIAVGCQVSAFFATTSRSEGLPDEESRTRHAPSERALVDFGVINSLSISGRGRWQAQVQRQMTGPGADDSIYVTARRIAPGPRVLIKSSRWASRTKSEPANPRALIDTLSNRSRLRGTTIIHRRVRSIL